jgi:hypothetical protein
MPRGIFAGLLVAVFALVAGPRSHADDSLRDTLKDIEIAPHWIYDDLPKALAESKTSNKPLLVVLRCVPCPPGRMLDMQVMNPSAELKRLEDQFVCVRVIQTNGLDLSLFQHDFDMSWAAVFLTPDKMILGRYGTRAASGTDSDKLISLAGFSKAAERALAIYKQYPANKQQLAAKLPQKFDFPVPEKTPGLADRGSKATSKKTCIHCHMVKEFALRAKWEAGTLSAADLYVYPLPQQIGLTLAVDDGLLVEAVAKDSPAARAGLVAGDLLQSLNSQPLISTADVQWVLHNVPSEAKLPVTFVRAGKPMSQEISLAGDWKKSDIAWRASTWYGLRGGLKVLPLTESERKTHGIAADKLALAVKGIFGKNTAALQAAGLKNGDIIVAVDGQDADLTESEFLVRLRLDHDPQEKVKFTVLRGNDRRELNIPMW